MLKSNGSTYKGNNYTFKQYKTKKCKNCPVRDLCTTAKANGKVIQRSEYQHYIEQNAIRMKQDPKAYKKRQAIVEHPYGVIKRQWGFYYIMTKKTIEHASADVGLIFSAYNLRRIFNLIDHNSLKEYLKRLFLIFYTYRTVFKAFCQTYINSKNQNIYHKKYYMVA
ncbi:transposase [Mariniflexile litorale]|uniref:Transposase n=1 Tax=Mariniflexile litorale TaxID=3045158 RepID=A0AAU7ELU0_9FLAO